MGTSLSQPVAGQAATPPGEVPGLTFGIYPGGATGVDTGGGMIIGPPDDPARIRAALEQLQGGDRPFIVRGYEHFIGAGGPLNATPADPEQYIGEGRGLDLGLCFRDPAGDLDGWLDYIRTTVRERGSRLATLQITEEPNNPNPAAGGDGAFPNVLQALVQGVIAAKDEAQRRGYAIQVGFNATPSFNPAEGFWPSLAALVTPAFLDALDYVGLDFFPDVFRPLAPDGEPGDLCSSVAAVLRGYREVNLAIGGIPPAVPIHIGENGWPTGANWPEARQAAVLEMVVRTIYEHRAACNTTHYTYFDLRDADSANPDRFHHFGQLRDDYTPKPAFATYRRLIAELGAS
jgi:hypothetical protein